jgi:hypothetical protein
MDDKPTLADEIAALKRAVADAFGPALSMLTVPMMYALGLFVMLLLMAGALLEGDELLAVLAFGGAMFLLGMAWAERTGR